MLSHYFQKLLLGFVMYFTSFQVGIAQSETYGTISPQSFEIKAFMGDTSIAAIVLFDVGKTHFELDKSGMPYLLFKRHTRIKIFKKSGYEYTNIRIPIYLRAETLENLRGSTYFLENGKVTEKPIVESDFFEDEIHKYLKIKKFTFPQVSEGVIVEYSYEQKLKNLQNLKEWEFQNEIPTLWSEYQITIPEKYDYKVFYQGVNSFYRRTKEKCVLSGTAASHANCYSWVMKNVPSFQPESFITTSKDFVAKIEFQINGVYVGGTFKPILSTWDKIAEAITDEEYFVEKISDFEFLGDIVRKITKKATSNEEKLEIIFDYVKTNFKWNQQNSFLARRNIGKIFESKAGNSAEINFILLKMLVASGIYAYPVVLSTRQNGKLNPLVHLVDKFNNVIILAKIKDRNYFLDATNPLHKLGMLPFNCLNRKGLMIASRKGLWIDIKPTMAYSQSVNLDLNLDETGKTSGKVHIIDNEYSGLNARELIEEIGQEKYIKKYLSNYSSNAELSSQNIEFVNLKNEKLPLEIKYPLETENIANNDRIYFEPYLIKTLELNALKQTDRKLPIDFGYTISQTYTLNLQIPTGFEVEELPQNRTFGNSNGNISFSYQIEKKEHLIQLKTQFTIQITEFMPSDFQALNSFFYSMINKQAEQIVLKRKL
jgi:hypothetical protein